VPVHGLPPAPPDFIEDLMSNPRSNRAGRRGAKRRTIPGDHPDVQRKRLGDLPIVLREMEPHNVTLRIIFLPGGREANIEVKAEKQMPRLLYQRLANVSPTLLRMMLHAEIYEATIIGGNLVAIREGEDPHQTYAQLAPAADDIIRRYREKKLAAAAAAAVAVQPRAKDVR
jgi:hypothetical protein